MNPRPLFEMACLRIRCGRDIKHLYAEQGRVSVDFTYSPLSDLKRLRGKRLHYLGLYGTPISDWEPLAELDFRALNVGGTSFSAVDLLAGKPLTSLEMYRTPVRTLQGIDAMPLRFLQIGETKIEDFSSIARLPLDRLLMLGCAVQDLSFLDGLDLTLFGCTFHESITGVEALRRMPRLQRVYTTEYDSFSPEDLFVRLKRGLPLDEKRKELLQSD